MSCLTPEELMSLVYGEDTVENIQKYKNHIKQCSQCLDNFFELNETRNMFKNKNSENPQVVILKSPKKEYGYGAFAVAAVFLMTLALSYFVTGTVAKLKKEQKIIAKKQEIMDKELQKASYLIEDYSKQNYMLMMGLKDYVDNNMKTMRASYEKY
jgi:hypothetical protein